MSEQEFKFVRDLAEINQKLNEIIYQLKRINETLCELKGAIQELKYGSR